MRWRQDGQRFHFIPGDNPTYVSQCSLGGGNELQKRSFGLENARHGALSGEHGFAPGGAKLVRSLFKVIHEEDLVCRATLQSGW